MAGVRRLVQLLPLGRGLRGKLGVLAAFVLTRLADRAGRRISRPLVLRLAFDGRPFDFAVGQRTDLFVLHEVFVQQQYRVDSAPETIVDLGANIGASLRYFAIRHPGARLYACEPDPRAWRLLERNTADIARLTLEPVAVGDGGPARLRLADYTWATSTVTGEGVEVPAATLSQLLRRWDLATVDLLKVDIEGAEWQVLADEALERSDTVVGELHSLSPSSPVAQADRFLAGFEVDYGPEGPLAESGFPSCTFLATRRARVRA